MMIKLKAIGKSESGDITSVRMALRAEEIVAVVKATPEAIKMRGYDYGCEVTTSFIAAIGRSWCIEESYEEVLSLLR